MKKKNRSISDDIKETFLFIFSMLFLGVMFVIAFFVVIIPRWVLKKASRIRK